MVSRAWKTWRGASRRSTASWIGSAAVANDVVSSVAPNMTVLAVARRNDDRADIINLRAARSICGLCARPLAERGRPPLHVGQLARHLDACERAEVERGEQRAIGDRRPRARDECTVTDAVVQHTQRIHRAHA